MGLVQGGNRFLELVIPSAVEVDYVAYARFVHFGEIASTRGSGRQKSPLPLPK